MKYYSKYWNSDLKKKRQWADMVILWIFSIIFMAFLTDKLKTPDHFISPIADKRVFAEEIKVSPTPTPTPKLTWDETVKIIVDEFKELGKANTLKAIRVAYCESSWEEKAVNMKNSDGSNDKGVFMANSIHKLPDEIRLDARENIHWAKEKVKRDGGWGAWVCQ